MVHLFHGPSRKIFMLKSTLDDLICEESESLCNLIRLEIFTYEILGEYHDNMRLVVTRLEKLIEERKNAR